MDLNKTLTAIEQNAANAIRAEQGDYINDDGLLMCGKCNTPKQVRIQIFGKEKTPFCLCKCAVEAQEREEAVRKRLEFERRIKELRRMGFPESEMQNWTFAKDDRTNAKLSQIAQNYVDHFKGMLDKGKGLLFYGKVGTGKTFISACIANALIDKGFPCLVTNFSRLTNTISGMFEGKQQYIDSLNRFDLLVIDDLASERDTEYMGEIVQTIIDNRYRAGLPIIITTNLTAEELKAPTDMRKQRIYSRLFDMCIPVHVEGKDRRKEHLRAEFDEYKDLLGL